MIPTSIYATWNGDIRRAVGTDPVTTPFGLPDAAQMREISEALRHLQDEIKKKDPEMDELRKKRMKAS